MSEKSFRVQHADASCKQKICLADYEQALTQHQENLFSVEGPSIGISKIDEFRRKVWGETNFGDRIQVHVTLPRQGEMILRLNDIATQGEVLYSDIQTLMEMGAVEFWVPDHFCRAGQGVTSYFLYSVHNQREFQDFIRVLDQANPMQHEAMGNVFGLVCLDDSFGGSGIPQAPTVLPSETPISSAVNGLLVSVEGISSSGCPDDDVDYFDEDTGKAVCEEPDPEEGHSEMAKAFGAGAAAIGATLAQGMVSAVTRGELFQDSLFKGIEGSFEE